MSVFFKLFYNFRLLVGPLRGVVDGGTGLTRLPFALSPLPPPHALYSSHAMRPKCSEWGDAISNLIAASPVVIEFMTD